MCPHLRSAESRLRRRTMKRPRPQQSPYRGRLALSVANRGLRCEFFSAGAEVGKVFARAEIRKAAREVMSSSATNAPRSPLRSLRGPSLSPRNLTRPEILLPHSDVGSFQVLRGPQASDHGSFGLIQIRQSQSVLRSAYFSIRRSSSHVQPPPKRLNRRMQFVSRRTGRDGG